LKSLETTAIVRLVLIASFAFALLLAAGGFYTVLHDRAVKRAALEAGRFLTTATAIRSYTDANIAPALKTVADTQFHPEIVPAFAAQTIFLKVQENFPGYTYREPTLNPTNPGDLPTPAEVELINRFKNDPTMTELSGVRSTTAGSVYFVARPIKAQESCLSCHDVPQRAPAAMVAKYGPHNGFGWKLGEIVGIQSLTVPTAAELRETGEIAFILAGGLLLIFSATYFALTFSIDSLLIRPLHRLAHAATAASTDTQVPLRSELSNEGTREVRVLGEAIERLRMSLAKSIERLGRPEGKS
jgi:hypothetical protein